MHLKMCYWSSYIELDTNLDVLIHIILEVLDGQPLAVEEDLDSPRGRGNIVGSPEYEGIYNI